MSVSSELDALLREFSEEGGPVMKTLAQMSQGALDQAGIDEKTAVLVRIAALVALDAPPASYLVHFALAEEAGLDSAAISGTLAALAPLVGTVRTVSAAGRMLQALQTATA
ncbi:MAG TPA: carboxymuconolactone decarboxylase family protein [Micromonosporaceae bacterium]|nr:carboxymuconolactone decarboxylase family protein [Micromonosporaceae bacterium]